MVQSPHCYDRHGVIRLLIKYNWRHNPLCRLLRQPPGKLWMYFSVASSRWSFFKWPVGPKYVDKLEWVFVMAYCSVKTKPTMILRTEFQRRKPSSNHLIPGSIWMQTVWHKPGVKIISIEQVQPGAIVQIQITIVSQYIDYPLQVPSHLF